MLRRYFLSFTVTALDLGRDPGDNYKNITDMGQRTTAKKDHVSLHYYQRARCEGV